MADVVHELLATEAAIEKLGARSITAEEAGQVPRNQHVTVRNPHGGARPAKRRPSGVSPTAWGELTLVIEQTIDPTTWLVITGWHSTDTERNLL